MTTPDFVSLKCLPVEQPIGVFYIGAMDADDLVAISWTDVRRIAPINDNIELKTAQAASPRTMNEVEQTIEGLDEDVVLIEDQDL